MKKILVVDWDKQTHQDLNEASRGSEIEVHSAFGVEAAVQTLAKTWPIHIICLNLSFGNGAPRKFLKNLRSGLILYGTPASAMSAGALIQYNDAPGFSRAISRIPVIALADDTVDPQGLQELGLSAIFRTPVRADEIIDQAAQTLGLGRQTVTFV